MYLPQAFESSDVPLLLSLMRRHPFATLIGVIDGAPEIGHVPLLVKEQPLRIQGHVARPNPLARLHTQLVRADDLVLGHDVLGLRRVVFDLRELVLCELVGESLRVFRHDHDVKILRAEIFLERVVHVFDRCGFLKIRN